eukprot:6663416-Heterocapsa_arctica.AAC.1
MMFQPRVFKKNRGSSGDEGIGIIKLEADNYCAEFGEHELTTQARQGLDKSYLYAEVLDLKKVNDDHAVEHTVKEFVEFYVHRCGRAPCEGGAA